MANITGYIRLIGQHHATHHGGAVLAVTDSPTGANPDLVHVSEAHNLVDNGDAEWVRGAEVPPESDQERRARHASERADLVRRHAYEHHALMSAHAVRETPEARAVRHQAERRGHLSDQYVRGQADEAKWRQLIARQFAEPETAALKQFAEHRDMIDRHAKEIRSLAERQQGEEAAAQRQTQGNPNVRQQQPAA